MKKLFLLLFLLLFQANIATAFDPCAKVQSLMKLSRDIKKFTISFDTPTIKHHPTSTFDNPKVIAQFDFVTRIPIPDISKGVSCEWNDSPFPSCKPNKIIYIEKKWKKVEKHLDVYDKNCTYPMDTLDSYLIYRFCARVTSLDNLPETSSKPTFIRNVKGLNINNEEYDYNIKDYPHICLFFDPPDISNLTSLSDTINSREHNHMGIKNLCVFNAEHCIPIKMVNNLTYDNKAPNPVYLPQIHLYRYCSLEEINNNSTADCYQDQNNLSTFKHIKGFASFDQNEINIHECNSNNKDKICVNFKNFNGLHPKSVGICKSNDSDACIEFIGDKASPQPPLPDGKFLVLYKNRTINNNEVNLIPKAIMTSYIQNVEYKYEYVLDKSYFDQETLNINGTEKQYQTIFHAYNDLPNKNRILRCQPYEDVNQDSCFKIRTSSLLDEAPKCTNSTQTDCIEIPDEFLYQKNDKELKFKIEYSKIDGKYEPFSIKDLEYNLSSINLEYISQIKDVSKDNKYALSFKDPKANSATNINLTSAITNNQFCLYDMQNTNNTYCTSLPPLPKPIVSKCNGLNGCAPSTNRDPLLHIKFCESPNNCDIFAGLRSQIKEYDANTLQEKIYHKYDFVAHNINNVIYQSNTPENIANQQFKEKTITVVTLSKDAGGNFTYDPEYKITLANQMEVIGGNYQYGGEFACLNNGNNYYNKKFIIQEINNAVEIQNSGQQVTSDTIYIAQPSIWPQHIIYPVNPTEYTDFLAGKKINIEDHNICNTSVVKCKLNVPHQMQLTAASPTDNRLCVKLPPIPNSN